MKQVERVFEVNLWESRPAVLTGVLASLLSAVALLYVATVDSFYMIAHLLDYPSPTLDTAERMVMRRETVTQVLLIHSLDDLKGRLAKVVLMILVVCFFEYVLGMHFKTPMDLLQLSGGIALLGLALYLSNLADKSH